MSVDYTANHQPLPGAYKTFEDLDVYKVAREFRKAMYQVIQKLPGSEKYALAGQIRRAAISLTNNIAEGHGRYHYLEQIKFTLNSRGSLEELMDDLNICVDEGYLPANEIEGLKEQACRVHRLINGYIAYLRKQQQGNAQKLRESPAAYGFSNEDFDDLLAEAREDDPTH